MQGAKYAKTKSKRKYNKLNNIWFSTQVSAYKTAQLFLNGVIDVV